MAKLTDIDTQAQKFFAIKSLDTFLPNLIQVIMILGALAALFFLLWGAISYLTSGGDKEAAKTARDRITHTVLGLAFLAASWVLWRLVVYFLGISSSPSGSFNINVPAP